jgi:hypothetical protein
MDGVWTLRSKHYGLRCLASVEQDGQEHFEIRADSIMP